MSYGLFLSTREFHVDPECRKWLAKPFLRIALSRHVPTCTPASLCVDVTIFSREIGAYREGLVGIWTPLPPSTCVWGAEGSDVRKGGPAQPHLPAVLGLHVAACHADAFVL